jgi:GR25 family glycosyltransferase involved in LPS biosynthesis
VNIAYVINLDRRKDRWERVQRLWSPYFDLRRVPATEVTDNGIKNGAFGCKLSHIHVAEKYLKAEDSIIVLEDDAEPTKWFQEIGNACINSARHFIDEWDYINCGAFLDLKPIGLTCATLSKSPSCYFFKSTYSHNTHMVMYNKKTKPILQASIRSLLPVDMFLGKKAKNQWVPIHLLATQDNSPSDIRKPHKDQHLWYGLSERILEQAVKNE